MSLSYSGFSLYPTVAEGEGVLTLILSDCHTLLRTSGSLSLGTSIAHGSSTAAIGLVPTGCLPRRLPIDHNRDLLALLVLGGCGIVHRSLPFDFRPTPLWQEGRGR